MARSGTAPLSALGVVERGFTTSLASAPAATVNVGERHADLNERGRVLLARLLDADPDLVTRVEALLYGDERADLVSPEEAAALLGVSRPTVVRWAAAGELTDHPVGSHHRYPRAEVLQLRQRRATEAAANRQAAQAARARSAQAGDLDVPPTPQEMIAAGRAFRDGDAAAAEAVFTRARRSAAHRSAEGAGTQTVP